MPVTHIDPYGTTRDGRPVRRFTVENGCGLALQILDYGCAVVSLRFPDRDGQVRDVVLGYPDLSGYEAGVGFLGFLVGRYANRIRNASFCLDGRSYALEKNDGENHLHGTLIHRSFQAEIGKDGVVFRYLSPDGDEGFPGNLTLEAAYSLTERNELVLRLQAQTDRPTALNLTSHLYFNLSGHGGPPVDRHLLQLCADSYCVCDSQLCPTGQIAPVAQTPMDFRALRPIGQGFPLSFPQLTLAGGYDHNYILQPSSPFAALAFSPESGIALEVRTTQPALQFYSGNHLHALPGKEGAVYQARSGFCLETQHYPCSPNIPAFPSTVLRPGEVFTQTTIYRLFHMD